jgi:hypothetical protein
MRLRASSIALTQEDNALQRLVGPDQTNVHPSATNFYELPVVGERKEAIARLDEPLIALLLQPAFRRCAERL